MLTDSGYLSGRCYAAASKRASRSRGDDPELVAQGLGHESGVVATHLDAQHACVDVTADRCVREPLFDSLGHSRTPPPAGPRTALHQPAGVAP